MKIYSVEQIKKWDSYTIEHEFIKSIDLMERAAGACFDWIIRNFDDYYHFKIFCGRGNNGGDGLAIARLLAQSHHTVTVNILEFGHKGTVDFQINLARLHNSTATIRFNSSEETVHAMQAGDVIIDALLGSGINRPADGLTAHLIQHINNSNNEVVAIDIPSGLFVDHSSRGNIVIKAHHTLSFQCFNPAFLKSIFKFLCIYCTYMEPYYCCGYFVPAYCEWCHQLGSVVVSA